MKVVDRCWKCKHAHRLLTTVEDPLPHYGSCLHERCLCRCWSPSTPNPAYVVPPTMKHLSAGSGDGARSAGREGGETHHRLSDHLTHEGTETITLQAYQREIGVAVTPLP